MLRRQVPEEDSTILIDVAPGAENGDSYGSTAHTSEVKLSPSRPAPGPRPQDALHLGGPEPQPLPPDYTQGRQGKGPDGPPDCGLPAPGHGVRPPAPSSCPSDRKGEAPGSPQLAGPGDVQTAPGTGSEGPGAGKLQGRIWCPEVDKQTCPCDARSLPCLS